MCINFHCWKITQLYYSSWLVWKRNLIDKDQGGCYIMLYTICAFVHFLFVLVWVWINEFFSPFPPLWNCFSFAFHTFSPYYIPLLYVLYMWFCHIWLFDVSCLSSFFFHHMLLCTVFKAWWNGKAITEWCHCHIFHCVFLNVITL
jgi:hypothetical protein